MLESWPAFALFLGAALVAVSRGRLRALVMLAAPLLGAWGVYQLEPGTVVEFQMMGLQLTPVRVDALSILFGYLFHLAAFIGVVYSLHSRTRCRTWPPWPMPAARWAPCLRGTC